MTHIDGTPFGSKTPAEILLCAARTFGQFVASGLLSRDEADAALAERAVAITADDDEMLNLERAAADALDHSITAHELMIVSRIRVAIMPLIGCRACTAAIIAQARHVNNAKGRLNAIPDADVIALVKGDLANAIARIREQRRA